MIVLRYKLKIKLVAHVIAENVFESQNWNVRLSSANKLFILFFFNKIIKAYQNIFELEMFSLFFCFVFLI